MDQIRTVEALAQPPDLDALSIAHDIGAEHEIPSFEPFSSFSALKDRIRRHYELSSEYYYSLWGEHIHHGYFLSPSDTKEVAQIRLIDLLLDCADLTAGSTVLDVGCGIGGTTRYLAKNHGCKVVGLTISGRQVEMAKKLTMKDSGYKHEMVDSAQFMQLGTGETCFIELDAELMGEYFNKAGAKTTFDCVWISEALSHFPDKKKFFENASMLLNTRGKLVIADWFKAERLNDQQMKADIEPIEDGMLLPPLCTCSEYVHMAEQAGLGVFSKPLDISKEVSKTWEISWSLIQSPALWAYALSQGRDGIAFLQAFRAMRRGYANETFRYAVMVFRKS